MARSGELERAVMHVLWDAPPSTAREVHSALASGLLRRELALTTVLTVLSRLEGKGLLTRARDGRSHRYAPVADRAEHTAGLMQDLLDGADDRSAVLVRFVGDVSRTDAAALRRALDDLAGP